MATCRPSHGGIHETTRLIVSLKRLLVNGKVLLRPVLGGKRAAPSVVSEWFCL